RSRIAVAGPIAVTGRETRSGIPAVLAIAIAIAIPRAARVLGGRALARNSSGRAPGRHDRERDEPLSTREDDRAIGILAVLPFSHRRTLASDPAGVQANLQRRPGRPRRAVDACADIAVESVGRALRAGRYAGQFSLMNFPRSSVFASVSESILTPRIVI